MEVNDKADWMDCLGHIGHWRIGQRSGVDWQLGREFDGMLVIYAIEGEVLILTDTEGSDQWSRVIRSAVFPTTWGQLKAGGFVLHLP